MSDIDRAVEDFNAPAPGQVKIDCEVKEEVEVSAILGTNRDSTELQTSAS